MTIASSTTIQAYQLRKGGTPARMAILRMIAADSVRNANPSTRLQPGDWRGARSTTLKGYASYYGHGLSQGFNGTGRYRVPVWYSFNLRGYFRSVRDADSIVSMRHTGWYADVDSSSKIIGIVVGLSHGRFAAGYRWTENGEHVIFSQMFDDETEAAQMADEHARVYAETCMEDSQKYQDAREVESELEDNLQRLRECIALRHRECMTYVREEAAELITKIRDARESLRTEFADYV